MSSKLKPIETVYKGYRFRSRTEARWAVFFDALGLTWEYEKQGYVLEDGTHYLPDFWLPDRELFVEIKGKMPTASEVAKCSQLAFGSGHPVFLLHGECGEEALRRILAFGDGGAQAWVSAMRAVTTLQVRRAIEQARGARFEFGESGAGTVTPGGNARAVRRAARRIKRGS